MDENAVVLGLDTAGPVVGVALVGAGEDRLWSVRATRGADALILPALAAMLDGVARLDGVAVSVGPGAFTSLRVGVAAALGIAMARGCPVVSVSSLYARALAANRARVLALLDGRKGKAYAAWYPDSGEVEAHDITPEEAVALPDGPFVATGEGAVVWRGLIEGAGGVVLDGADESPALAVARYGRLNLEHAVAPDRVRLNYLRAADAMLPHRGPQSPPELP